MSMLESLRIIVQEVNQSKDIKTALSTITTSVCQVMDAEVCSIYLLDRESDRYVFMSTEGLNKKVEGKLSLARDEGLVGLTAQRAEVINLDNAPAHPAFKHLPSVGEDPFNAFMGVPIIHQREVLGVLVVQQRASRKFDESEESFLVTVAAQLAGVIAHAQVVGAIEPYGAKQAHKKDVRFYGVVGCPGVALGEAVVIMQQVDLQAVTARQCDDVIEEVTFFSDCLEQVRMDINELRSKFVGKIAAQEVALFDVYLQMLDDNTFKQAVIGRIQQGLWAQSALSQVIMEYVRSFELMDDLYLRERAADIKDLGLRILGYLQKMDPIKREYADNTILISEELTASMLGEVPREKLAGIISIRGSSHSHAAILARSMGIPAVVGVTGMPAKRLDGMPIIVDAYSGFVIANASPAVRKRYQVVYEEEQLISKGLEKLKAKSATTLDGHSLPLMINTGLMSEITKSLEEGVDGIGLFRTEIPFMLGERFPTEDEQRQIYRQQLSIFSPKPVTMRTLDIGGDKALPYFPIAEDNPFLGWRGIRITLDHPEVFLVQIRAMLKASIGMDNLHILLPMISTISELDEAKVLLQRTVHELQDAGLKVQMPKLGVMIEVPSAIYLVKELAEKVDFLSVGSNDLTQYLLAVDRNNTYVSHLYNHYHPAVLRACNDIAKAAKNAGKPVSVCGELAGDPAAAVLLMAMGFDYLSMNAINVPKVKSIVRFIKLSKAKTMLKAVLKMDNAESIQAYLEKHLDGVGIAPIFRPKLDF